MEKKALAILFSPKSLIDFTWYYYAYARKYKWDALIFPCGEEIIIDDPCKKSGLFEHIYMENVIYNRLSLLKMGILFGQMLLHWLIGNKKKYVRKFFEEKIGNMDYDLHLVFSDWSALSAGLLECLADETKTVVLEDGMADYVYRTKKFCADAPLKDSVIGYLMCHMGYASLNTYATHYVTDNTMYCEKYATHPERMKYTNYKSISRLRDMSKVDIVEYNMCLRKMYDINDIDGFTGDVILFTAPLLGYFNDISTLIAKTVNYIVTTYSPNRVIIKKHPRDKSDYVFPENIEVAEMNAKLPGELLLQLITCKKHIFMYPSSLLMSYSSYDAIEVLIYKNLTEKNDGYLKSVRGDLASLHITNERVTEI